VMIYELTEGTQSDRGLVRTNCHLRDWSSSETTRLHCLRLAEYVAAEVIGRVKEIAAVLADRVAQRPWPHDHL
jgi:hypothetical protein